MTKKESRKLKTRSDDFYLDKKRSAKAEKVLVGATTLVRVASVLMTLFSTASLGICPNGIISTASIAICSGDRYLNN
jgi:hypothetical protein